MKKVHKILCLLLALLLVVPVMAPKAEAAEGESKTYIQEILRCLLEEKGKTETENALKNLELVDSVEAQKWKTILNDWYQINGDMVINENVLPDGLPQDDSLAIVVMGYQLNENGSVKPELLDRLGVAIRSARKYPNAYVICTGGATSSVESITEAGEMARWLTICGVDESRIIIEDASYSTTENARNTCEILQNSYKNIRHLAIVTSDYHIRRSCLMFSAASAYASGTAFAGVDVVSNAVCKVENAEEESLRTKVWGLAILAGVDMPE